MKYSLYTTKDKSKTLFNHERNEHYHSYDGALQEAYKKYFFGCHLDQKLNKQNSISIFEVGFGLGINLIPILKLSKLNKTVTYTSTENDPNLFPYLISNLNTFYDKDIRKIFTTLLKTNTYRSEFLNITILDGDVRQSIKSLKKDSFDAIYHDPFSPYKNTECWTVDFFKEEYRVLKIDGILSTYSMSTPVRSGLFQAGFNVWEGIGDKTKTTGTIASKNKIDGLVSLSSKMKLKFFESPDRIPFCDPNLNLDHITIKENRLNKKTNKDYSDIIRTDL